jgi:putative flippase GtrA
MNNTYQLIRYVCVGGSTAVVLIGSTYVLVEILALNVILGSTISCIVTICYNYLMHYHWTFKADAPHGPVLIKYLMMCAVGLLLNGLVMYFGQLIAGVHFMILQLFGGLALLVWNMAASYLWVYNNRSA